MDTTGVIKNFRFSGGGKKQKSGNDQGGKLFHEVVEDGCPRSAVRAALTVSSVVGARLPVEGSSWVSPNVSGKTRTAAAE